MHQANQINHTYTGNTLLLGQTRTKLYSLFGTERTKAIPRVVKKILSSRRIRESSWHVFPGGAGRGRHITIDADKHFNPGK